MKTVEKTIVPRNPYVAAARQRQAGAHDKSHKSKRQQEKRLLHKSLRTIEKGGDFPAFLFV